MSRSKGWCFGVLLALLFAFPSPADDAENPFMNTRVVLKGLTKELRALHDIGWGAKPDDLRAALEQKEWRYPIEWERPVPVPMTGVTLYRRCRESVVLVSELYECDRCSRQHTSAASGFIIHQDGLIATNYHVLEGDTHRTLAMGIRLWDGRVLPVESVVAGSKAHDLVVLRVEAKGLRPLPLAESAPVGTPVYCLSHPVEAFYTLTRGMVSGNFRNHHGTDQMMITADFAKGSSGGPILDVTGAVVGVVCSTSSVYYDEHDDDESDLQMVWKQCIPSRCLMELLTAEDAEED